MQSYILIEGDYIMSSIKDVAKRAKVGSATVSRVINNTGYVSEETREKILKAIEELNYTPNELARNLFKKKAGIIAIIVPNIAHPFFCEFVKCAEEELFKAGYKVMLCNTAEKENVEHEFLEMLERHIVDGIITDVHTLDVEEYKHIDKPIVALDRYLGKNIPVVSVDHAEGGRLAAEELLRNGCKKVLHFRGAEMFEAPFLERHREFDRVMEENSVDVVSFEIEWNQFDDSYFKKAIGSIFENGFDYDGIFGGDLPAIECVNECLRRNIKIPEEVKIVAYDGTYVTNLVEPKVTSIVQPINELAKETVRILLNMQNGKVTTEKHTKLHVTFKKGRTTQ